MKINIVIDISPLIPYLAKFWVSSYGPKCCQPIKLHYSLTCNTSRKKLLMNFIFDMKINIEVFYKLMLSFWKHFQSTQISLHILQYLPKSMGDNVDYLPADKHKGFLQVANITSGVHSQTCPKYPKQQVYNIFAIPQGKHEE